MRKRILVLTMGLVLTFAMVGCGSKKDSSGDATTEATTTADETTADGTAEESTASTESPLPEKVEGKATLGEYTGIEVEMATTEVTDEEVDSEINSILASNATSEEITDRAVQDGDSVNIDFEGLKDGVAFDGGTAKAQTLVIGSGTFIEGFEEGLIGAKIGDEVALNLTFPEVYQQNEDLAGQDVVFNVKVNSIAVSKTPTLTDEFVASVSETSKNVKEYKEEVKANLVEKKISSANSKKITDVWTEVINNSKVDGLSQSDIDAYAVDMKNYYTDYASYYGMEYADFLSSYMQTTEEAFETQCQEYAQAAIKEKLVIQAIADKEKLNIDDEEYKKNANEYVKSYGYESLEAMEEANGLVIIKDTMLKEKVQKYVAEKAVVKNN